MADVRRCPHTREAVACRLWEECPAERSHAYLRKALWQLQPALHPSGRRGCELLRVDGLWLQVDHHAEMSLDVGAFEAAHARCRGLPGAALAPEDARALAEAVALYHSGARAGGGAH